MSDFDSITYYVSEKKFRFIYLLYVPLFASSFLGDKDLSPSEAWITTAISVAVCVVLSELLFKKYVREITAVRLATDGLETRHADKKRHVIPYDKLIGPDVQNLGIIKKFTFRHMEAPTNTIIVTSITDNYEDFLREAKHRIENVGK